MTVTTHEQPLKNCCVAPSEGQCCENWRVQYSKLLNTITPVTSTHLLPGRPDRQLTQPRHWLRKNHRHYFPIMPVTAAFLTQFLRECFGVHSLLLIVNCGLQVRSVAPEVATVVVTVYSSVPSILCLTMGEEVLLCSL